MGILLGIALHVGAAAAQPASPEARADTLLPGRLGIGGALGFTTVAPAYGGAVRLYVHPVVIDVDVLTGTEERLTFVPGGGTSTTSQPRVTSGELSVALPWAQRRGLIPGTRGLSTVGGAVTAATGDAVGTVIGIGAVSQSTILLGSVAEAFLATTLGLAVYRAEPENDPIGYQKLITRIRFGLRFYP